ncbi:MAG: glycine cleavage system aminomethyltransferase GcvT [bacterium]
MNQTPLFEKHVALGATMGDFGGWNMPLWYKTGQIAEHKATRENCGLFDICHMGEFIVTGKDSIAFWQKVLTNNVATLADGQAQYSFMLNESGGAIDDCIVYRFNEEKWMVVVNAGTQLGDFEWLKKHLFGDVKIENISDSTGKLDLQGPNAPKLIAEIAGREAVENLKFFRFVDNVMLDGIEVLLSRTGYTGEIGFEIYCNMNDTVKLWDLLMEKGEKYGITPVGLGARDTLRLEAGLPLSGSEISPDVPAVGTPWEFVISDDHDFIGKAALAEQLGKLFIYPVELDGRRKPGPHSKVVVDGAEIGELTSEILAVSLGMKPAGFIRVNKKLEVDSEISLINAKGQELKAFIRENPLVKGTSKRKMSTML